ncbi:MAG: hypothetical protein HY897_25085 [Deltaproteobacteria bacterium]|nr:hypothetical protein [Deltaproteobacteria bacterium]
MHVPVTTSARPAARLVVALVAVVSAGGLSCGDNGWGDEGGSGAIAARDGGTAADGGSGPPGGPLLFVVMNFSDEAAFLNAALSADDLVGVYAAHGAFLSLVTRPGRALTGPSIPALQEALLDLGGTALDYLVYNPEIYDTHGTPQGELDDPPGAVAALRPLTDALGSGLGFFPDLTLLETYGAAVAPLVDLAGIQAQRYQLRPDELRAAVAAAAEVYRGANPAVKMFAQLFMAPPVYGDDGKPVRDANGEKVYQAVSAEEVIDAINLITDLVDGVVIAHSEETEPELTRFLGLLRPAR